MDTVKRFFEQHKDRFLSELFKLMYIPSVSMLSKNKEIINKAAHYVKERLLSSGTDKAVVMETQVWPVIYAEKIIEKDLLNILIYWHYDVSPTEPFDEWRTLPFEPEIKDIHIYGHEAENDKGQLFMQINVFKYMVSEDKLPCNVKFPIEGEEETEFPSLKRFPGYIIFIVFYKYLVLTT
jgi:acetylornithine deacetylase/succinyl-diaminopimelate desuccinylase-like protein